MDKELNTSNKRGRAYLSLFVFFIGWAAKDVLAKVSLGYVDPMTFSLIVSLAVVISVFLFIQVKRIIGGRTTQSTTWTRSMHIRVLLLSLFTALALYLSIVAIDLVGPVGYAVTDVVFYAIWVALISFLLIGEIISKFTTLATIVSIIGFIVFYLGGVSDNISLQLSGIVAASLSSLFYALSLVIIKDLLSKGVQPENLILYRFLLLALLSLLILRRVLASFPYSVILSILLLGVLGYAVLFMVFFYALRDVPATLISVFVASGPVFIALFTWLIIPGTSYTIIQIGGLAIILFGLLFAVFGGERETTQ